MAARYAALPERERPRDSRRRLLALLGVSVVLVAVYIASIALRDTCFYGFSMGVTVIYYLALPALILAFVILNHGLSGDVPTREQLSDGLSDAEKDAFILRVQGWRRRSRPLLVPIIPLAVIVAVDLILGIFLV